MSSDPSNSPNPVRQLSERDRDQWRRLWKGYQAFYEVDLSDGEDALFKRLLGEDDPYCLVYEEDGQLLGLTQYIFHATTWSELPVCYLQDLFTAPQARGKGVGRALIEAVYDAADRRGVSRVYWLTQESNHTARELYDKVAEVTPFIRYIR